MKTPSLDLGALPLALVVLLIVLSGCVVLPIPTPAHAGYGVITDQTVDSLECGKTTRADVLLRLGDPSQRIDEDHLFVYRWERTHGYLLWAIGGPGGGAGDILALSKDHFLVMEFSPDHVLKGFKFIDPGIFQDPREHLDKLLVEWSRSPVLSE